MSGITSAIFRKIPFISLVFSVVVAWLLVPVQNGFPMVPFSIFFVGLSTLVYILRSKRTWFDTFLYAGIIMLSLFLVVRANEVVRFIDFIFIILFGSILILPIAKEHTLANLFVSPFAVLNQILTGKNKFFYSMDYFKSFNKAGKAKAYVPSILITIVFLAITIPLLSSANPFFNNLVQNLLSSLNLEGLVQFFVGDQLFIFLVRLTFFLFMAFVIPRLLSTAFRGDATQAIGVNLPVNYLIPKIAMGILLVVFFITQAQLYFADASLLQSMGYTNSRLTNEVFLQVTVVAFIIFFLAYLDRERKYWHKILSYFLILEAFFLVGIAFKSVFDYSYLWGFTQKRLWGYATMTWLTGALLIFLYYYAKKLPLLRFFQIVITYTIVILIGINIVNFDYLISHYSVARTQSGTDYVYLTKLSSDASYYRQTLENLIVSIEMSDIREGEQIIAALNVMHKIERLQKKYNDYFPLNSFNFSEYTEYLNVRDINTQAYRAKISEIERKFSEQVNPNPQSRNELNSN